MGVPNLGCIRDVNLFVPPIMYIVVKHCEILVLRLLIDVVLIVNLEI